jgi:hypothetical protein
MTVARGSPGHRRRGRRRAPRLRSGPAGAVTRPQRFPYVNRFCMALLYGRGGRLTRKNGGLRPGQASFAFAPTTVAAAADAVNGLGHRNRGGDGEEAVGASRGP